MEENVKIAERISDLLYRDLLGLTEKEEQLELESLKNKYHLKNLNREEIIAGLEREDFCTPTEKTELMKKLRILPSRKKSLFMRWASAAAVIVVTIGVCWWLYPSDNDGALKNSVACNLIQPGQSNAVITLTNGQQIGLKRNIRQITECDGSILKAENGVLVYPIYKAHKAIKYHTLSIPRGGEYRLELSDGTKVWLNAESELKYPLQFNDSLREVYLKGEAFFEVAKKGTSRFKVYASRGSIEVLGTAFNVRDYDDEAMVATTLVSGKVAYFSANTREKIVITPGYQVIDKEREQPVMKKVTLIQYTGWKDGKYVFENTTLENIMKTLARWYNIDIVWSSQKIKELHFTGNLKRYDSIDAFLKLIATGGDVKFTTQGKTIFIDKK